MDLRKDFVGFTQIVGEKPIAIRSIVARSVDPEVLEKMRVNGEWPERFALRQSVTVQQDLPRLTAGE